MNASMERLVLKHRPAALLGGTLEVTEMVLDEPRIELVSGEPTETTSASEPTAGEGEAGEGENAAGGEGGGTSLALEISKIRLENGSLVQRSGTDTTEIQGLNVALDDLTFGSVEGAGPGRGTVRIDEITLTAGEGDAAETTSVRGFELEVAELAFDPADPARLSGATMRGDVRVEEMVSGDTQARDTSGKMELAGGQFQLQDLRLTTPQGDLNGKVEADLGVEPMTYSLRLDGEALSTSVLLGLGEVGGLGTSKFELSASGTGSDVADVLGNGRLTFNGGTLPDHPALVQVEKILGNAALVGVGYDSFPLDFDIRNQRVNLAECELRAGPISLTLSGWVDFDGPLEMKLSVLTPREGLTIAELPKEVLDALAEEDGRVNLPMLMTGTSEATAVALDKTFLEQQGKRYVKKAVEKEIGKALGSLFGRKKKDDG